MRIRRFSIAFALCAGVCCGCLSQERQATRWTPGGRMYDPDAAQVRPPADPFGSHTSASWTHYFPNLAQASQNAGVKMQEAGAAIGSKWSDRITKINASLPARTGPAQRRAATEHHDLTPAGSSDEPEGMAGANSESESDRDPLPVLPVAMVVPVAPPDVAPIAVAQSAPAARDVVAAADSGLIRPRVSVARVEDSAATRVKAEVEQRVDRTPIPAQEPAETPMLKLAGVPPVKDDNSNPFSELDTAEQGPPPAEVPAPTAPELLAPPPDRQAPQNEMPAPIATAAPTEPEKVETEAPQSTAQSDASQETAAIEAKSEIVQALETPAAVGAVSEKPQETPMTREALLAEPDAAAASSSDTLANPEALPDARAQEAQASSAETLAEPVTMPAAEAPEVAPLPTDETRLANPFEVLGEPEPTAAKVSTPSALRSRRRVPEALHRVPTSNLDGRPRSELVRPWVDGTSAELPPPSFPESYYGPDGVGVPVVPNVERPEPEPEPKKRWQLPKLGVAQRWNEFRERRARERSERSAQASDVTQTRHVAD